VSKPCVLLVDDNSDTLEMYAEFLVFHGYAVVVATNGQEAIEQARNARPALIVMDIAMPVLNGVLATRCLREDSTFQQTPIIALTGRVLQHEREAALSAGFDEFVGKPCLPDVLLSIVERLVRTSRPPH
jgi:CheY-like chemotaxis protein